MLKIKMNPAKRDTISPPREMSLEERMHLTGRVPQETTTVSKAYFNLTVCVIASALLSIPYSFDKTGSYFIQLLLFVVYVFESSSSSSTMFIW